MYKYKKEKGIPQKLSTGGKGYPLLRGQVLKKYKQKDCAFIRFMV